MPELSTLLLALLLTWMALPIVLLYTYNRGWHDGFAQNRRIEEQFTRLRTVLGLPKRDQEGKETTDD